MGIHGVQINGINVIREHDHYVLQKNGIQMRCDLGELNDCIPEFEKYIEEIEQERKLA